MLKNLVKALKIGGVLCISLKQGTGEKTDNGRFFAYYEPYEIKEICSNIGAAEIVRFWQTEDVRGVDRKQTWLNFILSSINS